MNQGADEAAAIIGGVVERCGRQEIALMRVSIDALPRNSASRRARNWTTEPARPFIANPGWASGALRDGVNDPTGQYQRIRPAATALL